MSTVEIETLYQKAQRLVLRETGFCATTLVDDLYNMYWACVRGLADRTKPEPAKMPNISFGEDEAMDLYRDVDGCEVYEHWMVSNWLANKLTERGERVVEISNLQIWCRTTTGQMMAADQVIEDIATEYL